MKRLITLALVLGLVACGGGGGSDNGGDFSGGYVFALRLIADGCALNLPTTSEAAYSVVQNGNTVSVTNLRNRAVLQGNTLGNGWVASAPSDVNGCVGTDTIVYNGDDAGNGALSLEITCVGVGQCATRYDASVRRD